MKSQYIFSATLNRRLAGIALLFAAVAGGPSMARAGSIVIGQINAPVTGGIRGITFDGGSDPLVIDGFGINMWSLNIQNASVIATFPISTTEVTTESLEFDAATGQYFTSTRPFAADDYLSVVNPLSGTLTDIGLMGSSFNFLDLAVDPVTGVLWMGNDCSNLACTSVQGGSLWTVNTANGAAQPVVTFGTSLGQLTALAISPQGQFFVASAPANAGSSSSIYEIDPNGTITFVTFVPITGDAPVGYITDMAFDPSTNVLYAVQEQTSGGPYLLEITGLPSPVPEPGTAISLVIGLGLLAALKLKRHLA
jgi:hypothetical protein